MRTQGTLTLRKIFLPVLEATLCKRHEEPPVLVHALRALTAVLARGHVAVHAVLAPARGAPHSFHLLLHSSTAVRQAAVALFSGVAARLDVPDLYALLRPALVHAVGAAALSLNPLLFKDAAVVCAPAASRLTAANAALYAGSACHVCRSARPTYESAFEGGCAAGCRVRAASGPGAVPAAAAAVPVVAAGALPAAADARGAARARRQSGGHDASRGRR